MFAMMTAGVLGQQGAAVGGASFPETGLLARYEAKDETGYGDGDPLDTIVDQFSTLDLISGTTKPLWLSNVLNGHAVYDSTDYPAAEAPMAEITSTEVRSIAVLASANVEGTARRWPMVANTGTSRILAVLEGRDASEWGSFVVGDVTPSAQNKSSGVDTTDWALVLVTWDGTNARMYIDGSLVDTAARSGTSLLANRISMGKHNLVGSDTSWLGRIAFAAVWTSTLDSTAIADLSAYSQATYAVG